MRKTAADRVSERFGNDPMRWISDDGKFLTSVMAEAGAREERFGRISKFILPDGSSIVVTPCGWYLSHPDCFCALGHEHSKSCLAGRGEES